MEKRDSKSGVKQFAIITAAVTASFVAIFIFFTDDGLVSNNITWRFIWMEKRDSKSGVKQFAIITAAVTASFVAIFIFFNIYFRSVYKELHADHETGAADNK